ncbi:hypothetical protein HOE425_330869 [Hoeflea sp. EC-HK425]|nr:hypothetical protein HOE425_330869 [Hoeflea sp. EC-HK425]
MVSRAGPEEAGGGSRRSLVISGPDRIGGLAGDFLAQGAKNQAAEKCDDHQGKQGERYSHHGCPFVTSNSDADTMTKCE